MSLLKITSWKIAPFVFTSILATITIYECGKKLSERSNKATKMLVHIGDNTLTILTWHMLSFKLVSLLIIAIYVLPIGEVGTFPAIEHYALQGWFVAYTLIGIFVPLLISKCKYLK